MATLSAFWRNKLIFGEIISGFGEITIWFGEIIIKISAINENPQL
ncbi:hypothetical protein [Bacillus sp. EB600]|nr:hypothetical protein [Bacillus sp. EB600]